MFSFRISLFPTLIKSFPLQNAKNRLSVIPGKGGFNMFHDIHP